jgi:hypothetical protein
MSSRAGPGDFFEVQTPLGTGYLRFVGRHPGPLPMDMFAVLDNPGWCRVSDVVLSALNARYFIGSSARYLPKDSRFQIRPNSSGKNIAGPSVWRFSRMKGWSIVNEGVEQPAREIDDDMAKLPIMSILTGDQIIEKMLSNWTPEMDRSDSASKLVQALRASSETTGPKALIVFLDFDTERGAHEAAKALEKAGFRSELGKGRRSLSVTSYASRDGTDWIGKADNAILDVASANGGHYAGNEVEL